MNSYILSCDPGINGVICKLNINTFEAVFFDLPTRECSYIFKDKKTNTKRRKTYREIDEQSLFKLIRELVHPSIAFICIESQQPYPNQGVCSQAKIVGIFKLLQGAFGMTSISVETVRPAAWKAKLGLAKYRKSKELSRHKKKCLAWTLAINLYPELKNKLTPRSYSFDKAESLLIAHYALNFLGKKYGIVDDPDYIPNEPAFA